MLLKLIPLVLLTTMATMVAQERQANSPAAAARKPPADDNVLSPDDQILIRAANVPDISEKPIRLDSTGYINMPMVGRVKAGGLTVQQLEAELTGRLKTYLETPEVAVSVMEVHSQPVSVIGEVATPGVQQVHGDKTLVEVLSMAGGPRQDAGPVIRITRRLEWGQVPLPGARNDATGNFSVAETPLKSLLDASNPETNILVRPDDVISVPRAEVTTIYVVGEVGKPGPIVLTDTQTMSILQAISSSGGILHTAAARHSKILRPIMGGPRRAELPVDINRVFAGKENDVPLLAGDILLVPGSGAKRASTRALEGAIQAGTMIATYGAIRY